MASRPILAALLLLCACGGKPDPDASPEPRPPAVVRVSNQNWQDVNVFIVQSGIRQRLGMVSAMGTAEYTVPQRFNAAANAIRLLVDPVGGNRTFLSHAVLVQPGQAVELRVHSQIGLSNIAIWGP
ncbi:MAG TPA: hypothetical protein VFQ45_14375 [Longimicrobium sp.]|nr:hypothetical protein [Longimicrobium sp.]